MLVIVAIALPLKFRAGKGLGVTKRREDLAVQRETWQLNLGGGGGVRK